MDRHDETINLDKIQELHLVQDLHRLSQEPEFGKKFKITLAKARQFNPVVLSVPIVQDQDVKVLITFHDYPATSKPTIQPRGGELSSELADMANGHLQTAAQTSMSLKDVVLLIQEVGGKLGRSETDDEGEAPNTAVNQHEEPKAIKLPLQASSWLILMVTLVIASLLVAVALVSLTLALALAIAAFVITALLAARPRSPSILPQEPQKNPEDNPLSGFIQAKQHTTPKDTLKESSRKSKPVEEMSSDYLLSVRVAQVFLLEQLLESILDDFSYNAPNEYAFICSGILTRDGEGLITEYYPGDMEISDPVYCKLTDDFIEKTVYDHIPKNHNLIVWGHVHPSSVPSSTDEASFMNTAEWDKEVAKIGFIAKRSIAMLIDTYDSRVSFYDMQSMRFVRHEVITAEKMAETIGAGGQL